MKRQLLVLFTLSTFALQAKDNAAAARIDAAATTLDEIMAAGDKAIPQQLLDMAECVVIAPGVKTGAFVFGARFGKGFISCRGEKGIGWSAPGAIRIEGGSFGFQAGGAETDVILLVMNRSGAEKMITKSKFTLGGEMTAAAGPVGRSSDAQTDATMRAEILSYSRARGLFGGIALRGGTLRQDDDANAELYGKAVDNPDIVLKRSIPSNATTDKLISALNKYSSRKPS